MVVGSDNKRSAAAHYASALEVLQAAHTLHKSRRCDNLDPVGC
jgi:hypothetical protein